MTRRGWLVLVRADVAVVRVLPGDTPRLDVLTLARALAREHDAPARIWSLDADGDRVPWASLPSPSALRSSRHE